MRLFVVVIIVGLGRLFAFSQRSQLQRRSRHATLMFGSENFEGSVKNGVETKDYEFPKMAKSRKKRSSKFPPSLYVNDEGDPKRGLPGLNVQWVGGEKERVFSSTKKDASFSSNRAFANQALEGALDALERDNLRTRLLNDRFYASEDPFKTENLHRAPSMADLVANDKSPVYSLEKLWITVPARLLTFAAAVFAFPYIVQLLDFFVTMEPDQLDDITSRFGPGIAILYGTFISLTLSILYTRQRSIQESASTEASLLVLMLRNTLSLFRGREDLTVDAGQAVADQVRTLVKSSRGIELMQIMYTDPYAQLFELVDGFEHSLSDQEYNRKTCLISCCRDLVKELTKCRSERLAQESCALPPTHFLILNLLTAFVLLAYCVNILPTLDRIGSPSTESTLIFGLLTTTYVLFDNFANDLNAPFHGVYQIRRSTVGTHLLEIKWLIANHPVLRDKVEFEDVQQDAADDVWIRTPGLGDCWFEEDEFGELENGNKLPR